MASKISVPESLAPLLNCKTNTAFFTYGRFQPAHTGHRIMIKTLFELAEKFNKTTGYKITPENTNIFVFVSPSGGPSEKNKSKKKKNPLTPEQKVRLLQKQYAGMPIHFINMAEAKKVGVKGSADGAVKLLSSCYKYATFVRGEDLDAQGNPTPLENSFGWLNTTTTIPIDFVPVARPEGAMSATKIRKAALGDYDESRAIFYNEIVFGGVDEQLHNEIRDTIRSSVMKGGRTKRKTKRKTKGKSNGE